MDRNLWRAAWLALALPALLLTVVLLARPGHAAPAGATPTPTRTATPTCTPSGTFITGTATLVPGAIDTGNHCDDCETAITLPFPYRLYDRIFTTAWVSANGFLRFSSFGGGFGTCLPIPNTNYILLPYMEDLRTDQMGSCTSFPGGCGIVTSVSGSAPNRIFNIEWRVVYFGATTQTANFEVRLYEGQSRFDVIYGVVGQTGTSAVVGAQRDECDYAQFTCGGGGLTQGLLLTLATAPPGTATPTATPSCAVFDFLSADVPRNICDLCTITSTVNVAGVGTVADVDVTHLGISNAPGQSFIVRLTGPAGASVLLAGSNQCIPSWEMTFDDEASEPLTCPPTPGGVYRPAEPLSAFDGQNADGTWTLSVTDNTPLDVSTLSSWGLRIASSMPCPSATPTRTPTACPMNFSDVQPSDYFYEAVHYLYCRGVVSGYADGTFRPYNYVTRGQLCKIIVLAEGWTLVCPPAQSFRDVPVGDPFYCYVETAYAHGIISGYNCGSGCREFRPGNNVTRAQLCRMVVLAETWEITTPSVPTFRDVPDADPFYGYIETARAHNVISGYSCGSGCLEFRPGGNARRGQVCKIAYIAITQP